MLGVRATLRARVAAAVLAVAALNGSVVVATTPNDDQARADSAIAAFQDLALDTGFESDGQPALDDDGAGEQFASCVAEWPTVLAPVLEPQDGETARAVSEDFSLVVRADESFARAGDNSGGAEFVSELVVTFDETTSKVAEQFVARLGQDETAVCMEELFDELGGVEPGSKGDVVAVGDLELGDHSASLVFSVDGSDPASNFSNSFYVAIVGDTVGVVAIGTVGDLIAVLDPVDALASLVESLEN